MMALFQDRYRRAELSGNTADYGSACQLSQTAFCKNALTDIGDS